MRAGWAVRAAVAAALVIVAAGGLLALRSGGEGAQRVKPGGVEADLDGLPHAATSALHVGRPQPLSTPHRFSRWTVVRKPTAARSAPRESARVVARLATTTPEGTENLLVVLGTAMDPDGHVWVRGRLPVLPNGTLGWVPRRALGPYELTATHLVVNRATLTATLYRNGRAVFRAPVGVGAAQWPTPAGQFAVRSKVTSYRSPFYGPIAFGTTARSAVLTDWPAGGFVGIHGTNEPQLLPGHVSHGCIRMRNDDILRLARLLPIGTPLTIR
jgi:hypothetical protein